MAPIRRARSVPKDLGSHTYEMTEATPGSQPQVSEDTLERSTIRRLVATESQMGKYMTAVRLVRIIQILLGPILVAINATLLVRYMSLQHQCPADSHSKDCEIYNKAVGAFKYCVVPGIIGMIQGTWCLVATFKSPLPLHTVVGADNFAAGFYMGGGCTLAALLNGWKCEESSAGSAGAMCSMFYTSVALFFLGVLVSYAMVPSWCYLRSLAKRSE